jgi:hypothetical protein
MARGDHERARDELAGVGDHAQRGAVAHDRPGLDALDGAHAARGEGVYERSGHGREVDDAGIDVEVPDVRVQVGEAPPEPRPVERLRPDPDPRQRVEALLRVRSVHVGRHGALGDVQAPAANERSGAGLLLELTPEAEGLVREARVGRIQVVVAERAGPAVGRRHRVADTSLLEHDHAGVARRCVVGRGQAHHTASDDDEVDHAVASAGRSSSA